jgi:3-deoxy-D-manno-octulosonic-acid transferase
MSFLLDVAYLGAGVAAAPWLAWKAATDPRYRHRLAERFGRVPAPAGGPALWFHCASVGEVNLIRPLVRRLRASRPGLPFYFSTLTHAGREQAERSFPGSPVTYFPFDFTGAARAALRRVRPAGLVLVELEVWPNFVEECSRRGVPVAVINGRISGRSFARYRRLRGFFSGTFRRLSAAGVQNETYAERVRELGGRPTVTGNLKFDAEIAFDPDAAEREWRALLGLGEAPVIVGGSTHDPEERLLVEAYTRLKGAFPALRLILAPRHRERLPEVVKVVEAAQLRCYKRSLLTPESSPDGVILLDTVGELARLYAAATVVFIGGTFCPRGGQNMLEPAALGKPILSGPSLSNFEDVARDLAKAGGMKVLGDPGGLAGALEGFLRDPAAAREAGRNAREAVAGGKGALEATLALIESNLLRGI